MSPLEPSAAPAAAIVAPERPEGVERRPGWPAWFGPVGFVASFAATSVVLIIAYAITGIDPGKDSPALTIVGTFVQDSIFVATAVLLAATVRRPRAWHFGLRSTPLGPAVGWAAAGMGVFYAVTVVYSALVRPDAQQDVVDKLGADQSTLGLVAAGIMVVVFAPLAEELFFRAFFYGSLRTRFAPLVAAGLSGGLFGLIHYSGQGTDGLLILPPLALLGFLFAMVYEKTGSLFPVIGMHAFNNAVAYSAQADRGWQVAVVAGPLVIAACVLVPRLLAPAPRPLATRA